MVLPAFFLLLVTSTISVLIAPRNATVCVQCSDGSYDSTNGSTRGRVRLGRNRFQPVGATRSIGTVGSAKDMRLRPVGTSSSSVGSYKFSGLIGGIWGMCATSSISCYTYLLTYPALQPLCGLGLPQECPKPLTVSRLHLPVRYPGLNDGRLHAILPPQFGPTTPPLSLWTA